SVAETVHHAGSRRMTAVRGCAVEPRPVRCGQAAMHESLPAHAARPPAGGRSRLRTSINVAMAGVLLSSVSAFAAAAIEGQVLGGGAPLENTTVTLWEGSTGEPKQLGQSKTDREGRFQLGAEQEPSADA